MLETITVPKTYSNKEVAQILGCSEDYVRQLKNRNEEDLIDLWRKDGTKTEWSQEGLDKLAELASTLEAKEYCRTALARRTQEAIAVDRSELNYSSETQSSTRTGHEVSSYELPSPTASGGRYANVPEQVGDAIGTALASPDGIRRMDTQVIKSFLQAVNLSDVNIDIETLLGKKS
jgi:hypothetical protein